MGTIIKKDEIKPGQIKPLKSRKPSPEEQAFEEALEKATREGRVPVEAAVIKVKYEPVGEEE